MKPKQPTVAISWFTQILSAGLILFALLGLLPTAAWGSLEIASSWSSNPCPPGKPFHLTVTISWNDEAGHYAVRPPQLDLPGEIIKQSGSVSSRSLHRKGENLLVYRWKFIAEKEATILPIPVKLSVFIKNNEEPSLMEIETEALVVDVPRWKGLPIKIIFLSGPLLLLAVIGFVWFLKKIKSPVQTSLESRETEPVPSMGDLMETLNKSRIQGDTLSFLQIAIRIFNLLCPGDSSDFREIKYLLDQAQYGNLKLSGEEMEQWYLRLKRMKGQQSEQVKN